MGGMKINIPKLHCLRCNYSWFPKGPVVNTCPNCKSIHWNKPGRKSKRYKQVNYRKDSHA
jgi:hypothetical protein